MPQVCFECLAVLPEMLADQQGGGKAHAPHYCSAACRQRAAAGSRFLQPDLAALHDYCAQHGERFPLMAARLALMRLSQAAPPAGADSASSSSGPATRAASPEGDSPVQGDPLRHLEFLCFANVRPPYPPPWLEAHELLLRGVRVAVAAVPDARRRQALEAAAAPLDAAWFAGVLARLHVNAFRVTCVQALPQLGSMAEAAAAVFAGADSAGVSGSAAYLFASLFNHSCEPNLDVCFPDNDGRLVLTAARDIAAGEQLTISYIDETAAVAARQDLLRFAYGFTCSCQACRDELGGARQDY